MKYLKGKNNSVYSNTKEKTPSKSEEEHTKEREPKETRRDDKETTSSDKDGDWHDLDKEWETFTNEWSNTQKDYGSEEYIDVYVVQNSSQSNKYDSFCQKKYNLTKNITQGVPKQMEFVFWGHFTRSNDLKLKSVFNPV